MRAFCITLEGDEYSERVASRCIATARETGQVQVVKFCAVDRTLALEVMQQNGLRWTWGGCGAGLRHDGYGGPLEPRVGCAMSHFLLWLKCLQDSLPYLILEHDAVFLRPFEYFYWD